MTTQDSARRAYRFFREKAFSQDLFSYDELSDATGWSLVTTKDYIGKQWRDVVTRQGRGQHTKLRVTPEFRRVSEERFLSLASQTRDLFVKYDRIRFDKLVQFEFLLPLTHEGQLRKALDDLFYTESILQRLSEIESARLRLWVEPLSDESDGVYLHRVCGIVSEKFRGYSISHVSGRYLADRLTTREEAARMLANEQRYIIDETTAAVRFIVPLEASRKEIEGDFEEFESSDETTGTEAINRETSLVRSLFLSVFAEAIVRTVEGEDTIWLIEEAPTKKQLYVWRKTEKPESDGKQPRLFGTKSQ
ncbi:MAG TPA: hypothetical protein VNG71_15490 [Pyrinomonadaceae bacterium]|nr:hypothetical protein [Pyrinomonadaceae bacterium]